MKKSAFCICKTKGADQLHRNDAADQCLSFCYIYLLKSLYFLIQIFMPITIFCGCTAQFVLDLVRNPEDRFFMT